MRCVRYGFPTSECGLWMVDGNMNENDDGGLHTIRNYLPSVKGTPTGSFLRSTCGTWIPFRCGLQVGADRIRIQNIRVEPFLAIHVSRHNKCRH